MLLCAQYILPITSEPFQDGAVLVRDGVIRDIGKVDMLKLRYPEEEVADFGLAALMPGLVDLHTHLENSVMRGIVHDVPYTTWILSVAEKSSKMDVSDWYDSAILGGLDALSSGITCVADITVTGAACTATQKLGLRSVIYREVGAMDKRRVDYAMRMAENDIMHWREEVDSSRITIGVAPAAIYTCHPSVFGRVAEFANRENMPVAMHLAGSREENQFVRYGSSPFSVHGMDVKRGYVEIPPWLPTGTSPVRYALNWGAFETSNVLAIHCVHVDEENVKKLPSVTTMLEEGETPEGMIRRVLDGFDVEFYEETPTGYVCDCSKERVERAIISIGKKEIQDMIDDQKPIEVNCHFCGRHYEFSVDDLKHLLKKAVRA